MAASAGAMSSSSRQRARRKTPVRGELSHSSGSKRNLVNKASKQPQAPRTLAHSLENIYEEILKKQDSDVEPNPLDSSVSTMPELSFRREASGSAGELDRSGKSSVDRSGRTNGGGGGSSNLGGIEIRHRSSPQSTERQGSGASSNRRDNSSLKNKSSLSSSMGGSSSRSFVFGSSNRSSMGQDAFDENDEDDNNILPEGMQTALKPLNDFRKMVGKAVNDDRVQNVVLLLIMINAIMMGIATFPLVKNDPVLSGKFETIDQVFLILFTIESGMQLLYHGWTLFKDGFLVFDLLIVVMSWALEGTQVIRAFRIFRALRLVTRIDTMRNLVLALFSVIPKMTAIGMLLMLIFYIFAVMFTQLFKDLYRDGKVEQPYFSGLGYSLFTLFQMMTLDEWASIQYEVADTYPWAWIPFLVFIVITGFVVVNLIIAVICDAVHVMGGDEKAGLVGEDDSFSEESNAKKRMSNNHGENGERRRPSEGANNLPTLMESYSFHDPANMGHTTSRRPSEQRLQELQLKLEEMVQVQDQMRKTIEALTVKLKENATSERRPTLPSRTSDQSLRPVS